MMWGSRIHFKQDASDLAGARSATHDTAQSPRRSFETKLPNGICWTLVEKMTTLTTFNVA